VLGRGVAGVFHPGLVEVRAIVHERLDGHDERGGAQGGGPVRTGPRSVSEIKKQ
jgi:hypothetical protein